MFRSSSAVFWMYNVRGLHTRLGLLWITSSEKTGIYPVRRAYQPVTTVVAMENDSVKIFGVNDGPSDCRVRFATASAFLRRLPVDEHRSASIPPIHHTSVCFFR